MCLCVLFGLQLLNVLTYKRFVPGTSSYCLGQGRGAQGHMCQTTWLDNLRCFYITVQCSTCWLLIGALFISLNSMLPNSLCLSRDMFAVWCQALYGSQVTCELYAAMFVMWHVNSVVLSSLWLSSDMLALCCQAGCVSTLCYQALYGCQVTCCCLTDIINFLL